MNILGAIWKSKYMLRIPKTADMSEHERRNYNMNWAKAYKEVQSRRKVFDKTYGKDVIDALPEREKLRLCLKVDTTILKLDTSTLEYGTDTFNKRSNTMKRFKKMRMFIKAATQGASTALALIATQQALGLGIDPKLSALVVAGVAVGEAIRNFLKHYKKLKVDKPIGKTRQFSTSLKVEKKVVYDKYGNILTTNG